MSVRLATGIRRVIPGKSTDPLGKGRIGRVWDLLWPMFQTRRVVFKIVSDDFNDRDGGWMLKEVLNVIDSNCVMK